MPGAIRCWPAQVLGVGEGGEAAGQRLRERVGVVAEIGQGGAERLGRIAMGGDERDRAGGDLAGGRGGHHRPASASGRLGAETSTRPGGGCSDRPRRSVARIGGIGGSIRVALAQLLLALSRRRRRRRRSTVASSSPVVASTMCPAVSTIRRVRPGDPPFRVDRHADLDRRLKSTAIRAVTPQLSSPTSAQAMTSSRIVHRIPPWMTCSQPSNRRSSVTSLHDRPGSTWRTSPRPPAVERAAGEAVVLGELEASGRVFRSLAWSREPRTGSRPTWPLRSPQTSRFWTFRASVLMKSLRGPTFSPISIVKISSASAAFSPSTRSSVRVSGFMVVSQS